MPYVILTEAVSLFKKVKKKINYRWRIVENKQVGFLYLKYSYNTYIQDTKTILTLTICN